MVVAVNKWDLEEDKPQKLNELREAFGRLLPQLRGAPMVMVSALTGKGLDRLHAAIVKAYAVWNTRISTARLNRWLGAPDRRAPAPRAGRAAASAALHDPGQDPAADLRAVRLDRRRGAGGLQALPGQRPAPRLRHARARRSASTCARGDNPYAGRRKPNVTSLDKHKPRPLEG